MQKLKRSRWLWLGLGTLGLGVLVVGTLHLLARPASTPPYLQQFTRYPLVIAHADDSGSGLWPGNTLTFLDGVAGLGVDVLEMDIHLTRDGVIVLMHDNTVDRTTNGSGAISALTLAELQALEVGDNWSNDDGQTYPYQGQGLKVPTLAEVFERFPTYPINLEIKEATPSLVVPLCVLIREHHKENQVIVASAHDSAMRELRATCPEVATAPSADQVRTFVYLHFVGLTGIISPDYQAFQVPERSSNITVVTPSFVAAAHQRNVQIHIWTINDPADMQRFISMGVDGIMTDRPDVLMDLLGR